MTDPIERLCSVIKPTVNGDTLQIQLTGDTDRERSADPNGLIPNQLHYRDALGFMEPEFDPQLGLLFRPRGLLSQQ